MPDLLSQVVKFSPAWWKILGSEVCNKVRRRVQGDHKNASGETFAGYSKEYAEKKVKGDAAGHGVPQASFSSTPDMTLTGKTMADLKVRGVGKDFVDIGWLGTHAEIIESLHNRKNYRVINFDGEPLHKKEMDYIHQKMEKEIEVKIKDWESKSVEIVV